MGFALRPAYPVVYFRVYPFCLISKKQVVAALEIRLPERAISLGRKEPYSGRLVSGGLLGFQERFPGVMLATVHEMPVIQPRPAEGLLRHIEGDGVDDVKPAARRRGGSTDVTRVVGYFGTQ